jgi:ABC-type dipeptide/oligopeptide/nickel transport system ATPase component
MNIKELLAFLKRNEFSLFLGAGASVPAGGPIGSDLISFFSSAHPEIIYDGDFFSFFDKLIKKDNSNRREIEDQVKQILSTVSPTDDHKYLFSLPFKAVLTTNYDRIPNMIIKTLDKNRNIICIDDSSKSIDLRRQDHLYVLKLFGDISKNYPQDGSIVLNNYDRRRAYYSQKELFKIFCDLARSGIIVYLGYSFDDELVLDILNEMMLEVKTYPHRGFAIKRNKPSEEIFQKMKSMNIVWVEGTFEDFIKEAQDVFGKKPNSYQVLINPIKLHNKFIQLDPDTLVNIRNKIIPIHQGLFAEDTIDNKRFFEGTDKSFTPYTKNWVFPRKWTISYLNEKLNPYIFDNIENLIKSRSATGNPADNMLFALIGGAGCGKSVLAKKIAYEWYKNENPVFYIDNSNVYIDSTAFEKLLDEIWISYKKQLTGKDTTQPVRYLVVCDNASLLFSQVTQLFTQLSSAGKPVDILLVDRSSELPLETLIDSKIDAVLSLSDTLNDRERKEFLTHCKKYDVPLDIDSLERNIYDGAINTSFFALIYTTIKESRLPLRNIIINEFQKKERVVKELYSYISLTQSFGLNPYYTIIKNISGIDFDDICELIDVGPLNEIIVYDKYQESFFTKHRIISEIIRDFAFNTSDMITAGFSRILSVCNSSNISEMNLIHSLLINSRELDDKIPINQKVSLYEIAVSKIKTRPLYIHLAYLKLDDKKYEECRQAIKDALESNHPHFTQPPYHVYDVQGRLELALALEEKENSWDHLEKAESSFKQAIRNATTTPHPVLGLAQTYFEMSKTPKELLKKMDFYLLALKKINELKNNTADWFDLSVAIKIERTIFYEMDNFGFNEENSLSIYNQTKNNDGYAFLAEKNMSINPEKALAYVNTGLDLNEQSIWLLRLRVDLLKKMAPDNIEAVYSTLEKYKKINKINYDIPLSFELAKIYFIKEYWSQSEFEFKELSKRTINQKNRLIPSDRWIEKQSPKKLYGKIVKIPTTEEWGELKSEDPSIPYSIPVRVRAINYDRFAYEDEVVFEIVFNKTGPQASNVNKR